MAQRFTPVISALTTEKLYSVTARFSECTKEHKLSKSETLFLVTVNKDGTLTTYAEVPKELPEVERMANNYDVYQAAKQIVEEFDNDLLANRVAQTVIQALAAQSQQAPSVPSTLKEKLKERGIDPESITPVE